MMSPHTPTTVIHSPPVVFRRRPIGSSDGQNFAAIDSLITATRPEPSRSPDVKPRPRTTGSPSTVNASFVTRRFSTEGGFLGSAAGWPSTSIARDDEPPEAGGLLMAATLVTPATVVA